MSKQYSEKNIDRFQAPNKFNEISCCREVFPLDRARRGARFRFSPYRWPNFKHPIIKNAITSYSIKKVTIVSPQYNLKRFMAMNSIKRPFAASRKPMITLDLKVATKVIASTLFVFFQVCFDFFSTLSFGVRKGQEGYKGWYHQKVRGKFNPGLSLSSATTIHQATTHYS